MGAKIKFTGLAILSFGILAYYLIVIGNTSMGSTWKIIEERRKPKVDRRHNYTQRTRLRAEQYHLRCRQLDQGQRQFKSDSLRNILVNDKHKLLYCLIPKIACSNLKELFLMLTGKFNLRQPLKFNVHTSYYELYLSSLYSYSKEETEYRLQHYTKVLFVREPFERILSAYRDKLLTPHEDYFIQKYGRQIIKTYRSNASKDSLSLGNDVTFGEFVKYLIELHKNRHTFDGHWATYSDLCSPCPIQYDFIGRFETLDDDVDFLLELIGVNDIIRFKRRNETYKKTKTKDVLYQFYRHIEPDNIKKLQKIYANDFKLFDYALPEEIIKILREKRP